MLHGKLFPKASALAAACALALFGAVSVFAETKAILKRDQVWAYDDGGIDLGSAWKDAVYNDGSWKKGKAPLGFGDDVSETDANLPIGTVIGFGPDPANKIMTTYFRTAVEVADPSAFADLDIYVHVDDGAVVYVNGVEVFRRGIPDGAVAFSTPGKFKPKEESFKAPASLLRKGKNLISAEVHQDGGDSSDLWFELGITATVAKSSMLLPRDAVWSYEDSGVDLGQKWITPSFDDSAWKKGKGALGFGDDVSETNPDLPIGTVIGFGPDPANKNMTTYFRTIVDIPSLQGLETLNVYVHVDDGAVIYINGAEAFRRGIPDGAVAFSTPGKFKPKEENFELPATYFKPGLNYIAAEVHQDGGDSSDLWWELGLSLPVAEDAASAAKPAEAPTAGATLVDPTAPLGTVTKAVTSIYGDPRRELGFNWFTTKASGGSDIQVVVARESAPDFSKALTFTGSVRQAANSPMELVHTGAAYGLFPATAYAYRVGDAKLGLWSATGSFKTATTTGAFTFVDLADTQAKSEEEAILSAKTLALALETIKDPAFFTINGDLVDVGMQEKQWDYIFGHAAPSLRSLPFVPAAGNHDEDKSSFIEHFALCPPVGSPTVSGAYYSFDYTNAHFIILNTNEDTPEWADLSPAQVEWFVADAKAAKAAGATWIVVIMHKGPYTTSNHATDADMMGPNGVRTKFAPLLDDLKIDLVLQGHDHIYARSWPIKDGIAVKSKTTTTTSNSGTIEYYEDAAGPVYVIPATAGPKTYYKNKKIDAAYYDLFAVADENHAAKYGPDPADASRPLRSAVQNFMSVTVDGGKLSAVIYEIDSKVNGGRPFVIDQFGLMKTK